MPDRRNADAEAATQYLTWALEDIERAGNQNAARLVRMALDALRDHKSGNKT